MKAEHRKELKTNTLISTLEKVGHGLKEGPSRRTVVVGGIVLLAVLVVVVWVLIKGAIDRRDGKRWEQLYSASGTDDLGSLVKKDRDTVQGRAARLQIARDELAEGLTNIYDEGKRDKAIESLKSAAVSFATLAKEYKKTPILVQECLYGEAQAREAAGELDKAIDLYEELADRFKDSPLAEQAAEQARKVKEGKSELVKLFNKKE